jgi:hypothetical protein
MARWVEDGTDTVGALSDSSEPPSPRRRHEQPGAFCRSGGVASRRPLPLARKALQRDRRRASARTARSPWRASWATPGALHTIVPNRDIAGPSDVRGAHLQLQARTTAARAGTGLHSSAWIEEAAAQRARTRNHAATFGRAGTWRRLGGLECRSRLPIVAPRQRLTAALQRTGAGQADCASLPSCPRCRHGAGLRGAISRYAMQLAALAVGAHPPDSREFGGGLSRA